MRLGGDGQDEAAIAFYDRSLACPVTDRVKGTFYFSAPAPAELNVRRHSKSL
jgi:hypothetical protein